MRITVQTDNFKGNLLELLGKRENEISPPYQKPFSIEGKFFKTLIWIEEASYEHLKTFPVFLKARIYKGGLKESVKFEEHKVFAVGIRSNDYLFVLDRNNDTGQYFFLAAKKMIDDKYLINWMGKNDNGEFVNLGVSL